MTRTSALENATQVNASTLDHATVAVVSEAVAKASELAVRLSDGKEILLPKELVKVLQTSAEELSAGRSVTILATASHLTPAEAARILGLSRPFIARLLDHGDIPSERLPHSRHRRIKLADVVAFQERRERRRAGSDRLAEIIESDDLPYQIAGLIDRAAGIRRYERFVSVFHYGYGLTLAELGVHEFLWSDDLLDEAENGIRVVDPDEYLTDLLGEVPNEILLAVRRMSARRKRTAS